MAVIAAGAVLFGLVPLPMVDRAARIGRGRPPNSTVEDVPDAIDVLSLGAAAGLDARQLVSLVVRRGPETVSVRLSSVDVALAAGLSFPESVRLAELDPGEPLAMVMRVLETSHVAGSHVAPALDRLGVDLRRVGARREQAAARRLGVRLTGPLVLCMFPAFALLTVVPVVAEAISAT